MNSSGNNIFVSIFYNTFDKTFYFTDTSVDNDKRKIEESPIPGNNDLYFRSKFDRNVLGEQHTYLYTFKNKIIKKQITNNRGSSKYKLSNTIDKQQNYWQWDPDTTPPNKSVEDDQCTMSVKSPIIDLFYKKFYRNGNFNEGMEITNTTNLTITNTKFVYDCCIYTFQNKSGGFVIEFFVYYNGNQFMYWYSINGKDIIEIIAHNDPNIYISNDHKISINLSEQYIKLSNNSQNKFLDWEPNRNYFWNSTQSLVLAEPNNNSGNQNIKLIRESHFYKFFVEKVEGSPFLDKTINREGSSNTYSVLTYYDTSSGKSLPVLQIKCTINSRNVTFYMYVGRSGQIPITSGEENYTAIYKSNSRSGSPSDTYTFNNRGSITSKNSVTKKIEYLSLIQTGYKFIVMQEVN